MEGGKRQTKEDMGWRNAEAERSSRGFKMQAIPTDFASWQYGSKNSYRVGHYGDGCRHTVPSTADLSHPESPGQPSQPVSLDVLETKVFDPAWVMSNEEWSALSWDQAQDTRCQAFVKRVGDESDTPTLRGWLLFVHDPTGRKKARPTGPMFCDGKALWFVDYAVERERTVLTKFTIAGDFVYRVSFAKPDAPAAMRRRIAQSTFRAENGYLAFEWRNSNQSGRERHVTRIMKVRVREPEPPAAKAAGQGR